MVFVIILGRDIEETRMEKAIRRWKGKRKGIHGLTLYSERRLARLVSMDFGLQILGKHLGSRRLRSHVPLWGSGVAGWFYGDLWQINGI